MKDAIALKKGAAIRDAGTQKGDAAMSGAKARKGDAAMKDAKARKGNITGKDTKRRVCLFSYYDQLSIQETLETMAESGWMLEKPGSVLWTYKRMEPKKLRFCVTYFPTASGFDPGPTDSEQTKIDYCREDGWNLAARWGVMQIFYSEDPNAVPIDTEPVTQVENLCRSMKRNVLFPQAVICAMLAWNLFLRFSQWQRDPAGELSDPFSLYSVLMFAVLLLACLYEVVFYFFWSRRAKAAAESSGVFVPIHSRPTASLFLAALAVFLLLLACRTLEGTPGFAALWLCAVPLIIAAGNLLKSLLKKWGAPRNINRIVSVCSVLLLTGLLLGSMTAAILRGDLQWNDGKKPVGTYELYGRMHEIYDDPLPLQIEDLADIAASERVRWSKEASHQETFLLAHSEYRQYAVPTGENDRVAEHELKYTVTEVKRDFLYLLIKNAMLNARQDEVYDGGVFTDHYEPVDASLWHAGEVYQLHWSDSVLDTYLVCWENRIAEVQFFWEPTSEQIALVAERLGEGFIAG